MIRFKHTIQLTAIIMLFPSILWAQPSGKEILDRIDALLFALPVGWLFLIFIFRVSVP